MDNQNNNPVGRPQANLEECFTKIQPFLQLSYSFHKACLYAQIPYTTYKKYYDENEDFHNKIDRERSLISVTARKNIIKTIENGDYKASLRWLESFEKEDFNIEPLDKKALGRETLAQVEEILKRINDKRDDGMTYLLTDDKQIVGYQPPSWFTPPDDEILDSNNV